MFNMTCIDILYNYQLPEGTLVNQDWVRYSTNELKFIRSECQKILRVKLFHFQLYNVLGVWEFKVEGKEAGEGVLPRKQLKIAVTMRTI